MALPPGRVETGFTSPMRNEKRLMVGMLSLKGGAFIRIGVGRNGTVAFDFQNSPRKNRFYLDTRVFERDRGGSFPFFSE